MSTKAGNFNDGAAVDPLDGLAAVWTEGRCQAEALLRLGKLQSARG